MSSAPVPEPTTAPSPGSPAAPTAVPHPGGWANPSPAGLVALAVATFGFWAVLTEQVTPAAAPYLGISRASVVRR